MPFLMIRCPIGNYHYIWQRSCSCGLSFYCGGHQGNKYKYVAKGWWHRLGTRVAVRDMEEPHPYLCVHHGGSPACDDSNKMYGYTCPRCITEKQNAKQIAQDL